MKYLIIVVEGQTEQEFVNDILRPYFAEYGIFHVSARLIRTSRSGKGGLVKGIDEMLNHCPRFKQWVENLKSQFAS